MAVIQTKAGLFVGLVVEEPKDEVNTEVESQPSVEPEAEKPRRGRKPKNA